MTLRSSPSLVVATAVAAILFLTGAVFTLRTTGLTAVSLGFVALSIVGILGVADAWMRRVVLEADRLFVVSLWSRRMYTRAEIESVTWEKGVGVALKLASGGWVKLSGIGRHPQGVTNTIRAWLKKTGQPIT